MTSQEVKELLGKPYYERSYGEADFDTYIHSDSLGTDMFYYYRIKDDIIRGWEIYLIEFSNNIVVDTSCGVEDW